MDSIASMHSGSQQHHINHHMNSSLSPKQISKQYIWPKKDLVPAEEELQETVVDLEGFFGGDKVATVRAANLVRESCLKHGFFQVINHGVDSHLIRLAHDQTKAFFELPILVKQKGQQQPGSRWGYSVAHSARFSTKLPWKEILTFAFHGKDASAGVVDFFESNYGKEFEETGLVFQKYCQAMNKLALAIMEILGISLGVDQAYFKEFYEDGNSTMRANFYPTCPEPGLTLGVGPHYDPTSLTILHQDQVGGLEIYVDDKWKSVRPRDDAFVINIGDTFTAISNGICKSCLHRVQVNRHKARISLTFFLNPREDKVVKPPEDLISREEPRKYPDFTWLDFSQYLFSHYRADESTLQNFTKWLISSKQSNS